MPWYWTDDIANFLQANHCVSAEVAERLAAAPVAVRRNEASLEAAASAMLEDDEIPLAA